MYVTRRHPAWLKCEKWTAGTFFLLGGGVNLATWPLWYADVLALEAISGLFALSLALGVAGWVVFTVGCPLWWVRLWVSNATMDYAQVAQWEATRGAWMRACVAVAFVRANRDSPFAASVADLVPTVLDLAGDFEEASLGLSSGELDVKALMAARFFDNLSQVGVPRSRWLVSCR